MNKHKHLIKGSYIPALGNQLVLYTNGICPFSHRIHLILNAKRIPYQTIYIDIFSKPSWFTQKSPLNLVPVLEVHDKTGSIIDSVLIAEYLDDKYPDKKLLPTDPYRKVRDKILILRFNAVLYAVEKIFNPFHNISSSINDPKIIDKVAQELFDGLEIFENELKKRKSKFFSGSSPGMVDYMIWPWIERIYVLPRIDRKFDLDRKRFDKIVEWCDSMFIDPIVKSCALTPDYYHEMFKLIKLNKFSSSIEFVDIAAAKRDKSKDELFDM
uniref:CSON007188 protein n=1 Tax=Culicoides sonorensis TaxID=179676 RepID=A0A336MW71_CULSO